VPLSDEGKAMMLGVDLALSSLVRTSTPPFATLATTLVEDPRSIPTTDGVIVLNLNTPKLQMKDEIHFAVLLKFKEPTDIYDFFYHRCIA